MSRAGRPLAAAHRAVKDASSTGTDAGAIVGATSQVLGCSSEVARQLLQGVVGVSPLKTAGSSTTVSVDMFGYVAFALKNELF